MEIIEERKRERKVGKLKNMVGKESRMGIEEEGGKMKKIKMRDEEIDKCIERELIKWKVDILKKKSSIEMIKGGEERLSGKNERKDISNGKEDESRI